MQKVLADVGAAAQQHDVGDMVDGILAMQGSLYKDNRDLMVVGRAVNGWGSGVPPKSLAGPAEANGFAGDVFDNVSGSVFRPMLWVPDQWHVKYP